MLVILPERIKAISGQIENVVFYSRNGKQFARQYRIADKPLSSQVRDIIETLSRL